MRALFLVQIVVFGILFVFVESTLGNNTFPSFLSIQGLNGQVFDYLGLNVIDPVSVGIFVFIVILNFFFLIDENNRTRGYYNLIIYRSRKDQYLIKWLLRSSFSILKQSGLIILIASGIQIIGDKSFVWFYPGVFIQDFLYIVKLAFFLLLMLIMYELLSDSDNGLSIVSLFFIIIGITLIDSVFNLNFIRHISSIRANVIAIGFHMFFVIILILLHFMQLKRGD